MPKERKTLKIGTSLRGEVLKRPQKYRCVIGRMPINHDIQNTGKICSIKRRIGIWGKGITKFNMPMTSKQRNVGTSFWTEYMKIRNHSTWSEKVLS